MPHDAHVPLPAGLRRVTDGDADALIGLVGAAFEEYPGCVLDLADLDADLLEPGTVAARRGSPWWVVERDGAVIATIGAGPLGADGTVELKRLYLARAARGHGLATALIRLVDAYAAGVGAERIELWTDTRFDAAHRRYAALGYRPTDELRDLHDPSHTTERRFVKAIAPGAPVATVTWHGPHGTETASLTALPDGWSLRTSVPAQHLTAAIEVDAVWTTRRADVTVGGVTQRSTSDGSGTWWVDGAASPHLAGASDVGLEASALTTTLPIRRLLAGGVDDAEVTVAWVRAPGTTVAARLQRYTRSDARTWRYRSATGVETELHVDEHGLIERYGDVWTRP